MRRTVADGQEGELTRLVPFPAAVELHFELERSNGLEICDADDVAQRAVVRETKAAPQPQADEAAPRAGRYHKRECGSEQAGPGADLE